MLLRHVDVSGFWFNPNIHPYTEFTSRRDSVKKLSRLWNLAVVYDNDYSLDDFLGAITGRGRERCSVCYEIRLDRTAETAKKMQFDGFTTSLLASPYQNFDRIMEKGREAALRHKVPFLAEDYRAGWKTSQDLSRELSLYRQKYCGCIYSEMERYAAPGKG
jgi:predicted adenine nucleotide alpha hydrolase (AANH) superfamily ATPase